MAAATAVDRAGDERRARQVRLDDGPQDVARSRLVDGKHQDSRCVRRYGAEAGLDGRRLALLVVRVLDRGDARAARYGSAHLVTSMADDHHKLRYAGVKQ